jgi:hypothetical protein
MLHRGVSDANVVATLGMLMLLAPVAAAAQTAYVLWASPASLMKVDLGQRLVETRPIPIAGRSPYVTLDGRFIVWMNAPVVSGEPVYQLSLFDLVTSQVATLPGTFGPAIAGHPRRPEIYLRDASGVVALSPAGVRRFRDFACGYLLRASISADGGRVAFQCAGATRGFVFDTDTGGTVMEIPAGAGWTAISHDGLSLFATGVRIPGESVLRRYAVDTGVLVVERSSSLGTYLQFEVEPRTGRLYPLGSRGIGNSGFGTPLDPDTLQDTASAVVAGHTWAFDRGSTAAIVAQPTLFAGLVACDIYVVGMATLFEPVIGWPQCPSGLVFAPLPAPPSSLSAAVPGSSVQLAWTAGAPSATTLRYVVEAGTAAGLANIGTFDVGLETAFAASFVPPGTYYVRVRAGNSTGLSAPSNEIVVTVP